MQQCYIRICLCAGYNIHLCQFIHSKSVSKANWEDINKCGLWVGNRYCNSAFYLFSFISFPCTLEDMGPFRYVKIVKLTTALGGREKLKVGFIIYHGTGPVWFKKTKQMKSSKFSFATWACTSSWVAVLGNAQVCSSGSDRSLHTSGRVAALQQWITERAPPSTHLQLQKLDLCKTPGIRKW